MDKAKAAIASHLGHHGEQKTHVHEEVAPAVTSETRNAHAHESLTEAVDRETHQHHYHTSIQPIQHKEVLPEQHHHNLAEVKHTTHDHRNHEGIKVKLEQERAKFKSTSVEGSTVQTTQSVEPTVAGERVHHHIHENIQPVIHKETVQPHVVHTTVPIHEVHHEDAKHHGATTLPAVSLSEFKEHGGHLSGREVRHDHFDGAPKAFASDSTSSSRTTGTGLTGSTSSTSRTTGATGSSGMTSHNAGTTSSTIGTTGTSGATGMTGHTPSTSTTSSTVPESGAGSHVGRSNRDSGVFDSTDSANRKHITVDEKNNKIDGMNTVRKPSLMDKLNPLKDADGDGKKGFMK